MVLAASLGCDTGSEGEGDHNESEGQHNEEESGAQYGLDETYDEVRSGVHLILSYGSPSNTFLGTARNTTLVTLPQVRVEVHLSNGVELGPTTPTDLASGQRIDISLVPSGSSLDTWSAHPEVGGEHGGG